MENEPTPAPGAKDTARISGVDGVFNPAELDRIERHGGGLMLSDAPVLYAKAVSGVAAASPQDRSSTDRESRRITKAANIVPGPGTEWIYKRMGQVVNFLNQTYRFHLSGQFENIQYMVYRDTKGSHFGWHVDQALPFGANCP